MAIQNKLLSGAGRNDETVYCLEMKRFVSISKLEGGAKGRNLTLC